ncbi:threonine--tRNA ligase 1, cytoplasmic-like [Brevipalpus obovatus]|uniref:threonine--tRNA ligase 1, cytoplasmic-like n=1 Tax=Brevipalpus obovatus TaxID=246614 RepID=UPI003D9E7659
MIQVRNLIKLIRLCDNFVCKYGHLRVSFCTDSEQTDQSVVNVKLEELDPLPEYIEHRQKLWDKFRKDFFKELRSKIPSAIRVKVCGKNGDESEVDTKSWTSTPLDVAAKIGSRTWLESVIISKVDGKLWDLERPLEKDCSIEFLTFEDDEGKTVFWHSSAHILGEALERLYGGHLCYGPPIENGFYYDMQMNQPFYPDDGYKSDVEDESDESDESGKATTVKKSHFPFIEEVTHRICNEKQQFERLELPKDKLLEMFSYNQFKVRILTQKVKEDRTTVYRCGSLVDLCLGPHIRHTGLVKALKVTKSGGSYWQGDRKAEVLQRVYGISFPTVQQMTEWTKVQDAAALRDHRKIGRDQKLFYVRDGSAFLLPNGAVIYQRLLDFLRKEYSKRGFMEVSTPGILKRELWEVSGHWQHYAENMFCFDENKYALKPMNCPGHCLIFDSETRSWKDLPIRYAEFGTLFRNEFSGALTGLTRLRNFVQDDAHIFCSYDQIEAEIVKALEFMRDVYSVFGFTFDMVLSTRPDSFIGDIALWDKAEKALTNALNQSGFKWKLNPGDGAFYGPKIDVTVKDALQRSHQCATIQLDFQLPIRFNLAYINQKGEKVKPCIIHRAIFGSVERFIAILTENFGGKWPFWISPRQVMVIPISESCKDFAEAVRDRIYGEGFEASLNADPKEMLNKKIRDAQTDQYNFILVIGEKEKENNTVNVRTRTKQIHGEASVDHLIEEFKRLRESRTLFAETEYKPPEGTQNVSQ